MAKNVPTIRVNSVELTGAAVDLLFGTLESKSEAREEFEAASTRKRGILTTAALHTALGLTRPMTATEIRQANAAIDDLVSKGLLTAEAAEAMRPAEPEAEAVSEGEGESEDTDGAVDTAAVQTPAEDPELDGPQAAR